MQERFTDRARKVMVLAECHARKSGSSKVNWCDLMVGLYDQSDGLAAIVLRRLCVVINRTPPSDKQMAGPLPMSECVKASVKEAKLFAFECGVAHIGPEHLLVGLLRRLGGTAVFGLHEPASGNRITGKSIESEVLKQLGKQTADDGDELTIGYYGIISSEQFGVTSPQSSCPADSCPEDDVVTGYMANHIEELKAELKAEKDLNRKLWVAVAKLQFAAGITWSLIDSTDPNWGAFKQSTDDAEELLDGIVALAPAEGKDAD